MAAFAFHCRIDELKPCFADNKVIIDKFTEIVTKKDILIKLDKKGYMLILY